MADFYVRTGRSTTTDDLRMISWELASQESVTAVEAEELLARRSGEPGDAAEAFAFHARAEQNRTTARA